MSHRGHKTARMSRSNLPDAVLSVLAIVCSMISIACCSAAVNSSTPVGYEAADISEAVAAAGMHKREQDLLNWAIEHSDPMKLQHAAAALTHPAARARRQREMQDVLAAMRQEPSEADLMTLAITHLTAADATDTDNIDALLRLKDLVRPIDNANDLKAVGGIEPLIAALDSSNADIRAAAADVLGTAASNNIRVQQDVADICPDILQKLLQVLQSNQTQTATKGLYALGKFLQNSVQQQQSFSDQGGMDILRKLFTDDSLSRAMRQKTLDLIGDLSRSGLNQKPMPAFLEAVVKMLDSALPDDWTMLERGLRAAQALASTSPQAGAQLLTGGLRKTLDAARSVLVQGGARGDEDDRAFAQELLQHVEQVGQTASSAASQVAAGTAAGGTASSDTPSGSPAAGGAGSAQPGEQPDGVMALGPAKKTGDAVGGSSSDEL